MGATRQRRQPDEAVHANGLKVLLATSSSQRPAPPRLTICAEAVFALRTHIRRGHMWVRGQRIEQIYEVVVVASCLAL